MFCNQCGERAAEDAKFCRSCGARLIGATIPSAPAVSFLPAEVVPPPAPTAPTPKAPVHKATTCPWCGETVDASQVSCPRCGATLEMPEAVTESGWTQLPGRRDMAKLQFGDSFCQIEGNYVPVADMNLAAKDSVYFTHHVLLWKEPRVNITAMSMAGAWKRVLAGLPLVMTQAQGPGHIAFSKDAPGETVALPIERGEAVDVREHLFMVATSHVSYDWFQTGIWYQTRKSQDETETHYPLGMFMDRFTAPQSPGLLLLHAAGNVFVRRLDPGQTILVKPSALIFKDPTVQMQLHFERPRTGYSFGWGSWGNRYVWLRLYGPGRIAVQSVFERLEGENQQLQGYSRATERQW